MQKTLFTYILFLLFTNVFAQKTEVSALLNSGLFSFSGPSAETVSFINYSDHTNSGYTNNPYGSKNGLCYGLSAKVQHISKSHFIAGFNLGFETLRSKILINGISGYTGPSTYEYTATGQTFLYHNFLNLTPFIGYRFNVKKVNIDITGGFDMGYCLSAKEKGNATAENGMKYTTSVNRKTIKTDIRPGMQLSGSYKKIGIYAGYSYGLRNYMSGYIGGINECYARLLRFGITYQIKW